MSSNRLWESEIREITRVLNEKEWEEEDAPAKLSQAVIRKVLNPRIAEEGGSLSQETIDDLAIEKVLPDNILTKIGREFPKLRELKSLTHNDIEMLIEAGIFYRCGLSPATCKRFLKGENIYSDPFKTLYKEFFGVSVVMRRSRISTHELGEQINDRNNTLQKYLIQFNHFNQKRSFHLFRKDCKSFVFLDLSQLADRNPCEAKWLLKCIFAELENKNHLVIYFNFPKSVPRQRLSQEIHKNIVKGLKSQKRCKLKKRINNESTLLDIAQEIAYLLKENNLIFVLEDWGKEINQQMIRCLENLIKFINEYQMNISSKDNYPLDNYLFFCCFFQYSAQTRTLTISPSQFEPADLSSWIRQYQDVSELLGISDKLEIENKVSQIWNDASNEQQSLFAGSSQELQPNVLLKAIYASCNCDWDDEDWITWKKPTL